MAWRSTPTTSSSHTSSPPPPRERDAIENLLGRSCTVRGDVSADGAIRIDGTVEGSVSSKGAVVVGESGMVRGGVSGCDVVIAGQVLGDIVCPGHLEILAKGRVEGDIEAKSMRIETGGVFCGTSRMGQQRTAAAGAEGSPEGAIPEGAFSPAA